MASPMAFGNPNSRTALTAQTVCMSRSMCLDPVRIDSAMSLLINLDKVGSVVMSNSSASGWSSKKTESPCSLEVSTTLSFRWPKPPTYILSSLLINKNRPYLAPFVPSVSLTATLRLVDIDISRVCFMFDVSSAYPYYYAYVPIMSSKVALYMPHFDCYDNVI